MEGGGRRVYIRFSGWKGALCDDGLGSLAG